MKQNITPTQNEIRMHDGEFIVSKTDTKGRVTYSNRTFMRISGFSEKQLLNTQHNIVRHPDMPRGVFRLLWRTLEQGREFFGYVKNLTADGSYYWVFANVTPDFDRDGKLMGYYSVRRKPRTEALQTIEPIYREMLAVEEQAGSRDGPDAAIRFLEQKLSELEQSYERFVLELQG